MKKCIVCGKEIDKRELACEDCLQFFLWKHGNDFAERIVHFKEYEKKRSDSRLTKSRRLNK